MKYVYIKIDIIYRYKGNTLAELLFLVTRLFKNEVPSQIISFPVFINIYITFFEGLIRTCRLYNCSISLPLSESQD